MNKNYYDCPLEATLEIVGGKWKDSILYYLIDSKRRFKELSELLETCSSKMLSRQLQELEHQQIIEREVFAEVPPKVEYSLTEYGRTLIPMIKEMCSWGEERLIKIGKKAVYN